MNNTLITQDRLDELVRLCKQTPNVAIAEAGVYKGGSLKYLAQNFPNSPIIVGFDTFEGLPIEQWNENEIHNPKDFNDTSVGLVSKFINDTRVELIKGLFPESSQNTMFESIQYSFVHVDFDFYEGIKAAIDFFYPRLVDGGIMVFDDYDWPNCPGVKRALDESGIPYQPTNAKFQAYLIKQ
jgi:O-methyltransferase